jgi:hypothetical protein
MRLFQRLPVPGKYGILGEVQNACLRHHHRLNKYVLYRQMFTLQRPVAMISVLLILCAIGGAYPLCNSSITTASGSKAPAKICRGDLVFNEEFETFDFRTWSHEKTAAGGGVSTILNHFKPKTYFT